MVMVATWNVENLFLPGTPDGPSSGDVYGRKLSHLASVISGADADVVCLQEVGGDQPLADLMSALKGRLANTAIGQPDDRGIRVAVISRFLVSEQTTGSISQTRSGKCATAHLRAPLSLGGAIAPHPEPHFDHDRDATNPQ
jgi:Endonuclease/Exonuclease/phosphatase family